MRFSLAVNRAFDYKLPPGDPEWGRFNDSFENVELTAEELVAEIRLGHSICAQHSGRRSKANFILAQHFCLDFDNHRFADVLSDRFVREHAAFLHTTVSNTAANPRCRAVFLLLHPIRSREKYEEFMTALVELAYLHLQADRSCKDSARFFFGSLNCQIEWLGNTVSLQTLADEIVLPYREKLREQAKAAAPVGPVIVAGSASPRLLESKLEALLQRVRVAPDGEKHNELNLVAYTLGGYVAAGYYALAETEAALQQAILQRGGLRDERAAYKTIANALRDGASQPIYFHDRPQAVSLRAGVAYAKGYARGFHDALVATGAVGLWEARGYSPGQVDFYNLGLTDRVVDGDGVILAGPALTMPCYGPGRTLTDVRYLPLDGGEELYETSAPLFLADPDGPELPLLLFSSPEDAVLGNILVGNRYVVGAAPLGAIPAGLDLAGQLLLPVGKAARPDSRIEIRRVPFSSLRQFAADGGRLEEFLQ